MIEWEGDDVLVSKSASIPEPYVNLSDYEKRYDDVFLPLLQTEWEGKDVVRSIMWAPLWYETLWVFYNKTYFPTVPKTWNDLWILYTGNNKFFPVNIGLGPRYTPDATDIIALFFLKNGVSDTNNIASAWGAVEEYLKYGSTPVKQVTQETQVDTPPTDIPTNPDEVVVTVEKVVPNNPIDNKALNSLRPEYDETWFSTLDSFIRGKIWMVIGFPSTIREIEKAQKRAGPDAVTWLILTERIPQTSLWKWSINVARYRYLALSNKSANPEAWIDFINYLMNPTTLAAAADAFPYLISPDRTISQTQWQKTLSTLFARARLDAFIPEPGESVTVFKYWLKTEYEKIFEDSLDRNDKIDINNLLSRIKDAVDCKIEISNGWDLSDKCLK